MKARRLTLLGSSTLLAGLITTAVVMPTASAGTAEPAAITQAASIASSAGQIVLAGQAPASTSTAAKAGPAGCRALERTDARMQKVEKRLSGSATTKGSIAWLKAKAAAEAKAEKADAAKKIAARAVKRTTELTQLTKTQGDLAKLIAADCR